MPEKDLSDLGYGHRTIVIGSVDIGISYDVQHVSGGVGLSFSSGLDVKFYQTLILRWNGQKEYYNGL